ncbi:MAG TPA: SGNH/GDSL hydrolase family protein [Dehalococcoidia bacterium]
MRPARGESEYAGEVKHGFPALQPGPRTIGIAAAVAAAVALLAVFILLLRSGSDDGATTATVSQSARLIQRGAVSRPPLVLPRVMASPPDVRLGAANAASSIPQGVVKPITGPEFTNYGHRIGPNSSGPWYLGTSTTPSLITPQPSAANAAPYAIEWSFDGSVFEVHLSGNSASYRLVVDGQYATPDEQKIAASDFAAHYLRVDFGSRAVRRIRLEAANNLGLDGIVIGKGDSVWRPAEETGPRVIVFGDSVVEGQIGHGNIIDSFVHQLGWLMGWDDIWASGSGGTGYVNAGPQGSQRVKLRDRLQNDVIKYKPDMVILEGGFNDATFAKDEVAKEVSLVIGAIHRALPSTKVVVLSPWYASEQLTKDQGATREAVKAAALTSADVYIDTFTGETFVRGHSTGKGTGPWITGTGADGSPASNGNADAYISSDRMHPTPAGHTYFAQRLAAALQVANP